MYKATSPTCSTINDCYHTFYINLAKFRPSPFSGQLALQTHALWRYKRKIIKFIILKWLQENRLHFRRTVKNYWQAAEWALDLDSRAFAMWQVEWRHSGHNAVERRVNLTRHTPCRVDAADALLSLTFDEMSVKVGEDSCNRRYSTINKEREGAIPLG